MSRYDHCPCPTRFAAAPYNPQAVVPYNNPPAVVPYNNPPAVAPYTPPVATLSAPPAPPTSTVTRMEVTTDSSSNSTKPLLSGDHVTYIIIVVVSILVTALVGFLRWYCRARMRQQQQSSAIPTPSVDPSPATPNALITFGPE